MHFDLRLRPALHHTLRNGIDVYSIDAGAEEVLLLELVYWAGNWQEEKPLVAASVNHLIKNGTAQKTAFELNEHFEYHGAYLSRACQAETATVTLHCLSKHLPALTPVIREMITEATFPQEELDIYRQNALQRLAVNLKKVDFIGNRQIDALVYGEEHPYGRFTRQEDFEALTRDDLTAFYDRYYRRGKPTIFVAGKLPENINAILDAAFGDLDVAPTPILPRPVKPNPERVHRTAVDPAGMQGAVRMATPFPNRHHPDFMGCLVLNNLLGGFFGSRLMANIREDKGYTYGIHSYIENHLAQSAWLIATEAGATVCDATVKECWLEMDRLRTEPVDDEELLLVKNYMMGSLLGDLDGPFQIIGRWKNLILHGLGEEYFYRQIQTIKNISPEDLQALAGKYFDREKWYELVVI